MLLIGFWEKKKAAAAAAAAPIIKPSLPTQQVPLNPPVLSVEPLA